MMTPNSYRVLSTNTTASLFCASAVFACGAIAEANVMPPNSFKLSVPIRVFEAKTIGDSGGPATSLVPHDYKLTQPFQLSAAAVLALGNDGVERLDRFQQLRTNWDGEGAHPLNFDSLVAFSQFFRDTGLRPDGLAVFMSRDGNIAVNWMDHGGDLIELEFAETGVHFFFEATGGEGVATPYTVATFLQGKAQENAA